MCNTIGDFKQCKRIIDAGSQHIYKQDSLDGCVSTRISKIPVLVRALPVLERVPVLVRAYARFSTGFAFSARIFCGQSRFDPADNAGMERTNASFSTGTKKSPY